VPTWVYIAMAALFLGGMAAGVLVLQFGKIGISYTQQKGGWIVAAVGVVQARKVAGRAANKVTTQFM
jgi:hypothetical protein